ncbi:hypothetical protein VNI00_017414 [Paramarasmius palmivorus]|uniref:Uncharacterized protein n=1 Tax=Paramarasmius palmivorus TaxID=297713 RepID=A0AAW0B6S1_9AGAR
MSPLSLDPFSVSYPHHNTLNSTSQPQNPSERPVPLIHSTVHNSPTKSKNKHQTEHEHTQPAITPLSFIHEAAPNTPYTPISAKAGARAKRAHNSDQNEPPSELARNPSRKRRKKSEIPISNPVGKPVPVFAAQPGFVPTFGTSTPGSSSSQIYAYESPQPTLSTPSPPETRPILPFSLKERMSHPQLSPNIRSFPDIRVFVDVSIPPGNKTERHEIVYTAAQQKKDKFFWFLKHELHWSYGDAVMLPCEHLYGSH